MGIYLVLAVLLAVADFSLAQYCEKNNEMDWSYHGYRNAPDDWKETYTKCGEKISPIRIFTDMVKNEKNLTKLRFIDYDIPVIRAEVENDGRMVILRPKDQRVQRGILHEGTEYNLQHIQFHFGSIDRPGAEHTINHYRFPIEIQFVHKNAEDKYAIVALFVDVCERSQHPSMGFNFHVISDFAHLDHNHAFDPILLALTEVTFKNESTDLLSRLVLEALLPESPASFYRYKGTLTNPPCDEAVWYVLRTATCIEHSQLDIFLDLYSVERKDASLECLMRENYSPLENEDVEVCASQ